MVCEAIASCRHTRILMTQKNIPNLGTADHGWSISRHARRRYVAAVGVVAAAVTLPMVFMLPILIPAEHAREEPGILAIFQWVG